MLLAAVMSMGGGVGVCASLVVAGTLSGHDATVLLPAIYLMGNPVQMSDAVWGLRGSSSLLSAYYCGMRDECAALYLGYAGNCLTRKVMNCSILGLTLFQRGHVYAPDDLGQQDILVAGGKIVAIAPSIPQTIFPAVSVSILRVPLFVRGLSISTFI